MDRIEELIKNKEIKLQKEHDAEAKALAEAKSITLNDMETWPLYDSIKDHITDRKWHGNILIVTVNKPGLILFDLHFGEKRNYKTPRGKTRSMEIYLDDADDAEKFFHHCRELYEINQQNRASKEAEKVAYRIRLLADKLRSSNYAIDTDPDEVASWYYKLVELDPTNNEWHDLWEKAKQMRAEYVEQMQQQKALATEYEEAYREWMKKVDQIEAKNDKIIKDLQTDPFGIDMTYHKLTYATMAADEDGYRHLETNYCYSLDDEPDTSGYYRIVQNGKITARKFGFVVSIDGAVTEKPHNHPAFMRVVHHMDEQHSYTLFVSPTSGQSKEVVVTFMARELAMIPQPPEPPEGLDSNRARAVINSLYNEYHDR